MKLDFVPSCRYEHGALSNVTEIVGADFALGGVNEGLQKVENEWFFSVQIFVCTTCGYTELFDGDIKATADLVKNSS